MLNAMLHARHRSGLAICGILWKKAVVGKGGSTSRIGGSSLV